MAPCNRRLRTDRERQRYRCRSHDSRRYTLTGPASHKVPHPHRNADSRTTATHHPPPPVTSLSSPTLALTSSCDRGVSPAAGSSPPASPPSPAAIATRERRPRAPPALTPPARHRVLQLGRAARPKVGSTRKLRPSMGPNVSWCDNLAGRREGAPWYLESGLVWRGKKRYASSLSRGKLPPRLGENATKAASAACCREYRVYR